jgi:hypothetical protein
MRHQYGKAIGCGSQLEMMALPSGLSRDIALIRKSQRRRGGA